MAEALLLTSVSACCAPLFTVIEYVAYLKLDDEAMIILHSQKQMYNKATHVPIYPILFMIRERVSFLREVLSCLPPSCSEAHGTIVT